MTFEDVLIYLVWPVFIGVVMGVLVPKIFNRLFPRGF